MDMANSNVEVPKKKKNIFQLLSIEAAIITVVGIIVVLILIIFKVIPFSFNLPLPFLSSDQTRENQQIIAASDDSSYVLSVVNEKELVKLLTDWGIFGKTFTGGYGILGSTLDTPVAQIEARFTTNVQPINHYVDKNGIPYFSSVTNASPGKLSVNAHIGSSILDDPSKNKDLGNSFDSIFLITLYNISHPAKTLEEGNELNQKLNEFLQKKTKEGKNYFQLKKK